MTGERSWDAGYEEGDVGNARGDEGLAGRKHRVVTLKLEILRVRTLGSCAVLLPGANEDAAGSDISELVPYVISGMIIVKDACPGCTNVILMSAASKWKRESNRSSRVANIDTPGGSPS